MANNHGLLFLNKALQSETFGVFARYGITEDSFVSANDRKTYRFIADYNERNGQMPSYAMTVDSVPEFTYIPEITDRFEPLAEGILNRRLAVAYNEFFDGEYNEIKENSNGNVEDVISELTDRLNLLKMKYTNISSPSNGLKSGVDSFLAEYDKRKSGEGVNVWESSMPFINEQAGGYVSGDLYTIFAKSGRGKSVLALREAIAFAMSGAKVVYWALEMPEYSVKTRLYSMLSALLEKTTLTTDSGKQSAGFSGRDIRTGTLEENFEREFREMLLTINEYMPGEIIIKAVNTPNFKDKSLRQLESDVLEYEADVAIIDPLYLLTMERNRSKTAGGDASATANKLRLLAGELNIPIIGITQAEEDESESAGDFRELKPPRRKDVKKSKAFLEDASILIGLDSDYRQQRAVVIIAKGRDGGESETAELTFIPGYGLVEQLQIDAGMFDF